MAIFNSYVSRYQTVAGRPHGNQGLVRYWHHEMRVAHARPTESRGDSGFLGSAMTAGEHEKKTSQILQVSDSLLILNMW